MKVNYSKDVDILMVELAKDPIDYAERRDNVIVHFDKHDQPVALEILHAKAFMKSIEHALPGMSRAHSVS